MQCKEWDDANSELFKESHDEAVHKNSYKSRLYELISASLRNPDVTDSYVVKLKKQEPNDSCFLDFIKYAGLKMAIKADYFSTDSYILGDNRLIGIIFRL